MYCYIFYLTIFSKFPCHRFQAIIYLCLHLHYEVWPFFCSCYGLLWGDASSIYLFCNSIFIPWSLPFKSDLVPIVNFSTPVWFLTEDRDPCLTARRSMQYGSLSFSSINQKKLCLFRVFIQGSPTLCTILLSHPFRSYLNSLH